MRGCARPKVASPPQRGYQRRMELLKNGLEKKMLCPVAVPKGCENQSVCGLAVEGRDREPRAPKEMKPEERQR